MSRLTELQRKAALIRFYLQKHQKYPSNIKDKISLLNMTRAGFEKWIRGETYAPRYLAEIDAQIRKELAIDEVPDDNLLDEDVGVMQLGRLLGLSRTECQIAVDRVAGELGPTFSIFSMENGQAESMVDLWHGLYAIYRIEPTNQAEHVTGRKLSVLRMALSVRYKLPGSKMLSRHLHRVRCKLNIPAYRINLEVHEYDGYITPTDSAGRHYWLFEIRKEHEKDIIVMMTETLRRGPHHAPDRRLALGLMISRTQDNPSNAFVWPIVLVRVQDIETGTEADDDFDQSAEKSFVSEMVGLLDPADVEQWILAAIKEAEGFSTFVTQSEVGESFAEPPDR